MPPKSAYSDARPVDQAMLEQAGLDGDVGGHFGFAVGDRAHAVADLDADVPQHADEALDERRVVARRERAAGGPARRRRSADRARRGHSRRRRSARTRRRSPCSPQMPASTRSTRRACAASSAGVLGCARNMPSPASPGRTSKVIAPAAHRRAPDRPAPPRAALAPWRTAVIAKALRCCPCPVSVGRRLRAFRRRR